MPEPDYHRLTRTRPRSDFGIISTGRSSLWLGHDHLLRIETTGYTETYRRFYFRDVQAILLRKTDYWKISSLVLAIVATGLGLIAVLAGQAVVSGIFGSLAGLFALGMVLNLAAGPSCKCYLRTAVQVEELPSLNRLRRARKALNRLRPLLLAAQGQLAPEEFPARIHEWMASTGGPVATPAPAPEPGPNLSNAPG